MSLPDAKAPQQTGVIHDIGYRGYQGPRLGRSYATRSLFTQGLRGAFGLGRSGRSKVLPMLLLALVTLPAAALVAITILQGSTELRVDYPEYLSNVGLLFVEIFVAAQAPVLLSRDLRNHTVPLYFSRPITRGDYVRAKFAAMVVAMLIVTVLPLLVLYLGALLGSLDFGHNTAHFAYGLLAAVLYSAVFSAVGLLIAAPPRGAASGSPRSWASWWSARRSRTSSPGCAAEPTGAPRTPPGGPSSSRPAGWSAGSSTRSAA